MCLVSAVSEAASTTSNHQSLVSTTAATVSLLVHRTGKKTLLLIFLAAVVVFSTLYVSHLGFRRSIHFWFHVSPMIAEYKLIKTQCRWTKRINNYNDHDDNNMLQLACQERISNYHHRTAPKLVALILKMGGIYVKIGQFLSSCVGIVDDTYIAALTTLQNGIPPRPIDEITHIVETSTGSKLNDIFTSFDSQPVGAATIAQAHKATLRNDNNQEVIVKVQYPEVAKLYKADFDDLKRVTKLLMPEQLSTIDQLRDRHEKELDFRLEAKNLIEIRNNMKQHGLEPSLIRIPRVFLGNMTTQHVLCMEYLDGISLKEAIQNELDDVAFSLGLDNAEALRKRMLDTLRRHFVDGGGETSQTSIGNSLNSSNDHLIVSARQTAATRVAAPLVRLYAKWHRRIYNAQIKIQNGASRMIRTISGGQIEPKFIPLRHNSNNPSTFRRKVDLGKAIKMLVMVHGVQVLLDGVYNADPHPGNVLIMEDGRLALLDYGMVGRLSREQRKLIAATVLAFQSGEKKKSVAQIYYDSGYRAGWINGDDHCEEIIYRFASFHLDRMDLSPVVLDNGERWDILKLLGKSVERSTPDWIEQMKRIGGLLIGVSSQAGRPISLSREWQTTARQAALEDDDSTTTGY